MNCFSLSSIKTEKKQTLHNSWNLLHLRILFFFAKNLWVFHSWNLWMAKAEMQQKEDWKILNCEVPIVPRARIPFWLLFEEHKLLFFLFTILPPNLIQLLRNEIFEESAIWREKERSKADPPPTTHKSHWGTILVAFESDIVLCGMWKRSLRSPFVLPFVNELKDWKYNFVLR